MTIKEMTKFLTFCKKIGLKRIKTDEFEADFSEIELESKPKVSKKNDPLIGVEPDGEPMPTEDDLLYLSCNYDPRMTDVDAKEGQIA